MPIRTVTSGDVDDDALTTLHAAAFADERATDPTPWGGRLARHSVAWVCAYDDERLVGFVHAVWDGGVHAFLLDTVVAPDVQHRGVGRMLVRELVEAVTAAGCAWLHVDYEPHLAGFYRACGFGHTEAGLLRLTA